MIYVIAKVELAEGKRLEYLKELNKVSFHVRAEEGCLQYGPAADVDTGIPVQEPIDENTITIIERWTDIEALKVHLTAPHMQTYREAVKDYVKRVTIRVLEPI
jgi:quinol monooxygenase YgiN